MLATATLAALACQREPTVESREAGPKADLGAPVAPESTTPKVTPARVGIDRTHLPILLPERPVYTELDVRDTKPPPRFEVTAPEGAPNVVVILLDDVGFGVASTFGGPVETPTLDRLAADGLRYNNFHTTALCSPTRVALKSGRNHHMANAGSIMESATAYPGDTGQIPASVAPLAEILRLNGYSTAAYGKWHETAPWETSLSGPSDRWPLRQGFDEFYGFIGAETNQWAPAIYRGHTRVERPQGDPHYHFLTDMTDHAIAWVQAQQSMTPDKPFFVYYAPGATHAPHHVAPEWSSKYAGKFDLGWDQLRTATFEGQKQLGVIPPNTKLAPKPSAIRDWDTLSDDEKKIFTRQAEVYAGYAAMADHEAGRLLDAIDAMGEKDNTLVIYIVGDNGASAEGRMNGLFNEYTYFNGVDETIPDIIKKLDVWGGPETYPHMAAGWAIAFDSPHQWAKQIAGDFGGTRNAMLMRWPQRIQRAGQIRGQFHHVIDIAPTVLEAASLPEPVEVNGVEQIPMQGVSMIYTFDDADAKSRHTTQYFEMLGNRGIYHDGWLARTVHKAPWEFEPRNPLRDDVWELYHAAEDFSLATDLAAKHPERLAELQQLFMQEAEKNHALPLDDRFLERMNAELVGRPDLMQGRTTLTLREGMQGLGEDVFINVKNKSFTVTAVIEPLEAGAHGVILGQGGRFGGWSVYVVEGKPAFTYNFLGSERYTVASQTPLPRGLVTLRFEFDYDGGGLGKGGQGTLYVNDEKLAEGRIEKTQPNAFSIDDGADVGIDLGTPVVEAFGSDSSATRFTGRIEQVTVEVKPD